MLIWLYNQIITNMFTGVSTKVSQDYVEDEQACPGFAATPFLTQTYVDHMSLSLNNMHPKLRETH